MALSRYVGLNEYEKLQLKLCELNIIHDVNWKYNLNGDKIYLIRVVEDPITEFIGKIEWQFCNGCLIDIIRITEANR